MKILYYKNYIKISNKTCLILKMGCIISNFIDRINVSVYNGETVRFLTCNDTDTLYKYINSFDIMKSFIEYEKIIYNNDIEYKQVLTLLYKYSLNEQIKQIITTHIDTTNIETFYDLHEKLNNEEYINITETNILFDMNDIKAIKLIILYLKNQDIIFKPTYKKLMKKYEYIYKSFPNKIDYNVYH